MTSVDELFKNSGIPSKRKLDLIRDPNEIYKSAKYSNNNNIPSRHARVEDDPSDDVEAGPDLPPDDNNHDGDREAGPDLPPPDDDDEGGRFFGGGISEQQARVLDYVESVDQQQQQQQELQSKNQNTNNNKLDVAASMETKFDHHWLRRTALAFEKKINKNAELRAKHSSDPARFMESEADVDQAVRELAAVAQWPSLYGELARLGTAGSVAGLLAHENADVAMAAMQTLGELTDEDVGAGEEEWDGLVKTLLADELDLLGLVGGILRKLDEGPGGDERDSEGVYYALALLENLCSGPGVEKVARDEGLVRWLLQRAQREELGDAGKEGTLPGTRVGQNKQYAAELLGILCSSSRENGERVARLDAVDALLQLAALYRRHDPEKGTEEEEFVGNIFEALTAMVDTPLGKSNFVRAEGVELVLIVLKGKASGKKDNKMVKSLSLRLLARAAGATTTTTKKTTGTSDEGGREVCEKIVQEGGLKVLFTMFMKRNEAQTLEQLLDVFASMLRLLPADSDERIRTLAKFVEKGYEKITRLVALRRGYAARLATAEKEIQHEKEEMVEKRRKEKGKGKGKETEEQQEDEKAENSLFEFEALSKRLGSGLFALQLVDAILAWLVAEDDGAGRKIRDVLKERDEGVEDIRKTLEEQIEGLDEDEDGDGEAKELRDVLGILVGFLV